MPRIVKWLRIAPAMTPKANSEPSQLNRGERSNSAAISSTTPEPIRPQGSAPTFEKMYTDSGAAVNLKNKVCSKMIAATIRKNQLKTAMIIDISSPRGLLFVASLRMVYLLCCVLVALFFDEAWPVLIGLVQVALR